MFLTGEFAKIARVSKRQLQYYDALGLFSPAHTDPQTGYRYYSAQQLPQLNRVLALKDLGFTLEQITQFIGDEISDDELQKILKKQKADLESNIINDLQRLRRIEARLQTPTQKMPDVVLKTLDAQRVLSIEHFCLGAEDGLEFMNFLLQRLPKKVPLHDPNRLIVLTNIDDFMSENVDLEFAFAVDENAPDYINLTDEIVLRVRTLPPVEVATLVHTGSPRTSHLTYSVLGRWIESHQYRMASSPRENFIGLNPMTKEEEIVIEIQVPIEVDPSTNPLAINQKFGFS